MLKVGVIGFGGGSALIPVMEKELVKPDGGLSERAFVQDTVIANITPGALPVKLAALSGIQLGGALSAVLSALVVALPGAVLTVALLASFAALGPEAVQVVEYASLGITAFILYLLAHYATRVISRGGHRRTAFIIIAITAYLATGMVKTGDLLLELAGSEAGGSTLPELSALDLVLVALVAIALWTALVKLRRGSLPVVHTSQPGTPLARILRAMLVFGALTVSGIVLALAVTGGLGSAFLSLITLSTVTSFGGGEAYVGVADGFFVSSGVIDQAAFYGQIVPVANALPGPILVKIAAGMGYILGLEAGGALLGALLALAAYGASIGACCVIALAVLAGYDKANQSIFVQNIASFILPVICGLLASTSVSMLHSNARIAGEAGVPGWLAVLTTIGLASLIPVLHRIIKVPDALIILACGALSLTLLLLVSTTT